MDRQFVLIVIALSVLAAGCGSNSPKGTTGSSSSSSTGGQELAFSRCMRAHGVPSFPDPGMPAGPGESTFLGIAIPATIDMQSPAAQAAFTGCRHVIAAMVSPQGKPPITGARKAAMIAHAQCMRTHGVPAYQDPTFPPGGGIETFDGPGVNPQSPAYQQAEADCAAVR